MGEEAVRFFLSDLATANEARESQVLTSRQLHIEEVPGMPPDVQCLYGVAEQTVAKFNEAVSNRVRIHLCAIRLLAQETDILVTLNDPVSIDPQSSSADAP